MELAEIIETKGSIFRRPSGVREIRDGKEITRVESFYDIVDALSHRKKGEIIDRTKHLVLMSAHPSPFSADRGFFGCKHFSKTNAYLKSKGKEEIDW